MRGLSGPWDWAVSLAPTALRLGERAVVVVVVVWFSFIFVECVFVEWFVEWFGLCLLSCVDCRHLSFLKEETES